MKAQIYAIFDHNRWNWHISVDLRIDYSFWFERLGDEAEILLLEPECSLGQAVYLSNLLNSNPTFVNRADFAEGEFIRMLVDVGQKFQMPLGFLSRLSLRRANGDRCAIARSQFTMNHDILLNIVELLRGRSLIPEELIHILGHAGVYDLIKNDWPAYIQAAFLQGYLHIDNGISFTTKKSLLMRRSTIEMSCRRCGSGMDRMYASYCPYCEGDCYYCEECLHMGRIRWCTLLIGTTAQIAITHPIEEAQEDLANQEIENWRLSDAQTEAVQAGLQFLERDEPVVHEAKNLLSRHFLFWAVTGAGKTEMVFPLIANQLVKGKKVLIATPRRDVVLELKPRLEKAFSKRSLVTLYGGSSQRWEQGEITLATTHQLLRFREAFDLIIIDEIDAFPYHNNPMLQFAANKAGKEDSRYILLSATPPKALQGAIKQNRLAHAKVPVRFHRHPLPIPHLLRMNNLFSGAQTIPRSLLSALETSIARGAQLFVFVSTIKHVEVAVSLLKKQFKMLHIDGTSSQDPLRSDKIQQFREGNIRILVTTTILERGVTIPKTDVYILNADSVMFDAAALIQMAGRAGRSKDDPKGLVYYAAKEKTKSQIDAIKQIKMMNKIASRKGYLIKGV